jgi:hypothetical protein
MEELWMRALITRLFGKRDIQQAIEGYADLVTEAAKFRELSKMLGDTLAFYADEESYEGDPVPVMKDGGKSARVVLRVVKEILGDSGVSA